MFRASTFVALVAAVILTMGFMIPPQEKGAAKAASAGIHEMKDGKCAMMHEAKATMSDTLASQGCCKKGAAMTSAKECGEKGSKDCPMHAQAAKAEKQPKAKQ